MKSILLPALLLALPVYSKSSTEDRLPHYTIGDAIPISCLNRTIDTGEHITDDRTGQLQYIPFPTCLETGRPLELTFGVEQGGFPPSSIAGPRLPTELLILIHSLGHRLGVTAHTAHSQQTSTAPSTS